MKQFARTFFALATLFAIPVVSVFAADSITKKSDGKKVTGDMTAMTKTDVTIKRQQGDETIAANDIALIEWGSGGGDLKIGYLDENNGRYEQAITRYSKAKGDAKSPSDFLRAEFDYVLARVAAKQALGDPEKSTLAIQKLTAAQKNYPDHIRYYESVMLLSQLQLATKDFAGARTTFEVLKRAPTNDLKLAAQIAEARVLMAEGKIDEASAAFEAAIAAVGDSPSDLARKYEAQMGRARGLIMQTKFEEALAILEDVTEKGPTDDSAVQAEAYVLLGHTFQSLGRIKDAVLAYLHVDLLFARESGFHAEALYHLINLWKLDQHPDRSAEAQGKLIQQYPNSEWRKKLSATE